MRKNFEIDSDVFSINMFKYFDTDHDGFLTFEEFTRVNDIYKLGGSLEELRADFDEKFDLNHDGKISLEGNELIT